MPTGAGLACDGLRTAGERLPVVGAHAVGDRGQRARAQARDAVPGDELGEVAPVRADVGERARRAAEVGLDAPVVVLGPQQPVLQVRAVHEPHRASLPAAHALARLADRRVVAVHERDASRTRPLAAASSVSRCAPADVDRQRLLADHVLAGRQRRLGERQVKVVRRADVHDVHVG